MSPIFFKWHKIMLFEMFQTFRKKVFSKNISKKRFLENNYHHQKHLLTSPWPVWLSRLEHRPINQKVMGSIPGQDTHLGCGFEPQSGCVREVTDQCFSLTLMLLSLSLSFSKINKHIFGWGFKKKERKHLLIYTVFCHI